MSEHNLGSKHCDRNTYSSEIKSLLRRLGVEPIEIELDELEQSNGASQDKCVRSCRRGSHAEEENCCKWRIGNSSRHVV
ncbi:uncharacterized protein [Pyrus communis]